MSTNCAHGKGHATEDVGIGDVDLVVLTGAFAEETVAAHTVVPVSAADFLSGSKRTIVWPIGRASAHADALVAFSSTRALIPLVTSSSLAAIAEGTDVEEGAAPTLDNLDLRRACRFSWALAICSSLHCRASALHAFWSSGPISNTRRPVQTVVAGLRTVGGDVTRLRSWEAGQGFCEIPVVTGKDLVVRCGVICRGSDDRDSRGGRGGTHEVSGMRFFTAGGLAFMSFHSFFVFPYLFWSMDILSIDPLVVRVRVPLPFYQILQLASAPLASFV